MNLGDLGYGASNESVNFLQRCCGDLRLVMNNFGVTQSGHCGNSVPCRCTLIVDTNELKLYNRKHTTARNPGVILDSNLSMKKNVIKVCQIAYFELKRISSICRFLTEYAAKTLVTSYILSRLDYCNCLDPH